MNAQATLPVLPQRVVLFDGVCAVCDVGMTWILAHDPEGRFSYAALQGETAAAILARHPELPDQLDSIVLVEQTPEGERVSWYSDAIFQIAAALPWPWRGVAWFRVLPRGLRDLAYRAFAAVRYRVFGKVDRCRLPTESEASRMLP